MDEQQSIDASRAGVTPTDAQPGRLGALLPRTHATTQRGDAQDVL